jgi:hypothetical protein
MFYPQTTIQDVTHIYYLLSRHFPATPLNPFCLQCQSLVPHPAAKSRFSKAEHRCLGHTRQDYRIEWQQRPYPSSTPQAYLDLSYPPLSCVSCHACSHVFQNPCPLVPLRVAVLARPNRNSALGAAEPARRSAGRLGQYGRRGPTSRRPDGRLDSAPGPSVTRVDG